MHAPKGQQERLEAWFYFYAPQTCLKEKRVLYREEWLHIKIEAERMMTVFPVQVGVKWQDNEFLTPEGAVSDGGYKILRTEAGEEILLIIKIQKEELFFCGKFFFSDRQTITIGTDFRYEIFYEYSSFFRERKILVYREKEKYILECISTGEESKNAKVYVNASPVKEKVFLEKGDRIEILGLSILFLPQMLICVSRYGVLRMAERRVGRVNKRHNRDYVVRQHFLPQEKVWEETLEIALPEAKKKRAGTTYVINGWSFSYHGNSYASYDGHGENVFGSKQW